MTGSLDLNPNYLVTVECILAEHVPECEVRAYGSRATWTAKDYSDLDLAVVGEEKLHWRTLAHLQDAFEDSNLPIRVDVLDWHATTENFREVIEKDYVVVQEGAKRTMKDVWQEVSLDEVAEIVMGQSPPGSTYNEVGEGLPFFQGVKDFNYRHPTPRVFCSKPTRVAQIDDILLSVRAPIGRVNVADRECATGRGLAIIRSRVSSDSRYIEFLLRSMESQWDALEASGSVFGNATKQDIKSLQLLWPADNSVRSTIAHILGTLDDKIEMNRRMNETLEGMARALFKSWFVDFEPVRAKIDGRWCRGETLPGLSAEYYDIFPDRLVDSKLGEIPVGWEVGTVIDVATIAGGTTPSTKVPAYWEDGMHCWATPKDLSSLTAPVLVETEHRVTNAGLQRIGSGLQPPDTVLMSSRAPIGYLAITEVPVAINQGLIAMQPREGIPSLFLLHWAESSMGEIMNRANGSTFLEISKRNFRDIPLLLPSTPLIEAYDRLLSPLHGRIVANESISRKLASLRDALLPKLVSGDIWLRDQLDGGTNQV